MAMHDSRIHPLNDLPVNDSGEFVLYWMQQARCNEPDNASEK